MGDYYNASHCADPTAYAALKKYREEREAAEIEHEKKRQEDLNRLIHALKFIIDLGGFELEGRIVLRDKETGRIYK